MTEPTLILSPRFQSDSQQLWSAAVKRNWNIHRAINYARPDDVSDCFIYGEILVCDIMAEKCGIGLLDPSDDWLAWLPSKFLKRDVYATHFGNLWTIKTKKFIKPANDKLFQRGVYQNGNEVKAKHVDSGLPVLVSDVVAFDREYRFWCLDHRVVTGDSYIFIDKELNDVDESDSEAKRFANEVLDHCREFGPLLPTAVVLDVGRIEGGGWVVIEANQAYASGIYGATDTDKVLDVVRRAAGTMDRVSPYDRQFLRSY